MTKYTKRSDGRYVASITINRKKKIHICQITKRTRRKTDWDKSFIL